MKKFLIIALVFISIDATAQFRNPGRGIRQSQTPNQNQPPEFKFHPKKAIGIVIYDVDKAAKKIGLKKSKPEFKTFKSTLVKFNKELNGLARINSFTFQQVKQNVEASHKLATESRDYSILTNAYKEASDTFKPIVDIVKEKEKSLDATLKSFLNKKQLAKWEKYKRKQKTKRP